MINLKDISLRVLLAYALILHPIIISEYATYFYIAIYGFALIYIILNVSILKKFISKISLHNFSIIILSILFVIVSIVHPVLLGTEDYTYIGVTTAIFRKLTLLLCLAILTYKKHQNNFSWKLFVFYYILSTTLYVVVTTFFIIMPNISEIWKDILGRTAQLDRVYKTYGYTTRFGWSGFSGFRETLDCSLSIVFLIAIYSTKSNQYIHSSTFYSLATICLLGNIYYGRVGTITSLICIIIGLFKNKRINIKTFTTIIIIAFTFISSVIALSNHNEVAKELYNWAIKPIYTSIHNHEIDSYSANHLLNDMIYVPEEKTIIIGDGRYTNSDSTYYGHTDSGFMRQILFWGIIWTSIVYLTLLISIKNISKIEKSLLIPLIVLTVLFEIKGEIYYEIIPFLILINQIRTTFELKNKTEIDVR